MVPLFGISTSVLQNKMDFEPLLAFAPQVVEFYNYPSRALPVIEQFCQEHAIRIALHTPVPYDAAEPLRRFAPTGPDRREAAAALTMVLTTLHTAARLNAMHVVVHFPGPYAETQEVLTPQIIASFLDPVMDEAKRLKIPVLIENLSSHPTFYHPEQYAMLLDQYEELGICLDLGHAHQLQEIASVHDFIVTLGRRIYSCHIYNQRPQDGRSHVPVHPDQSPDEGWIDIRSSLLALGQQAGIRSWILEPDSVASCDMARATEGTRWLQSVLQVADLAA